MNVVCSLGLWVMIVRVKLVERLLKFRVFVVLVRLMWWLNFCVCSWLYVMMLVMNVVYCVLFICSLLGLVVLIVWVNCS